MMTFVKLSDLPDGADFVEKKNLEDIMSGKDNLVRVRKLKKGTNQILEKEVVRVIFT